MAIVIKKADLPDLSVLESLSRQTFIETFGHLYTSENLNSHLDKTCSAAYFRQALASGRLIDLALMDDVVAGYITYGDVALPVTHEPADAEIHRLYIDAAFQRQGIGDALMRHALAGKRLRASPNVYLGVWEHNHKAQAFYRRFGFYPVGEYLYYVGTHADREIIMRRI